MLKYLLPIVTSVCALLSLLGWMWNIEMFKNFNSPMMSIKTTTGFCLLLTSISQILIIWDCRKANHWKEISISALSWWIWGVMGAIIFKVIIIGEEFAYSLNDNSIPSIVTIYSLLICGSVGIIYLWNTKKVINRIRYAGWIVIAVGISAITGYLTGLPIMYYYIKHYVSPLSLIGAILFVIIGITFITISDMLEKCKANPEKELLI